MKGTDGRTIKDKEKIERMRGNMRIQEIDQFLVSSEEKMLFQLFGHIGRKACLDWMLLATAIIEKTVRREIGKRKIQNWQERAIVPLDMTLNIST